MSPSASLQPTRTAGPETALPGLRRTRRPYSVLLPVGFAVPPLLPVARWALTPPFHPCPARVSAPLAHAHPSRSKAGRFAFCGTFPGVAPAGRYPAPCFHGARTFLTRRLSAFGEARLPGRLASRIKGFAAKKQWLSRMPVARRRANLGSSGHELINPVEMAGGHPFGQEERRRWKCHHFQILRNDVGERIDSGARTPEQLRPALSNCSDGGLSAPPMRQPPAMSRFTLAQYRADTGFMRRAAWPAL